MTERELLRNAVDREPVPHDLHARVRTHLLHGRQPSFAWLFGAAALCALFVVASAQAYMVSILRIGLKDHIHCAVESRFPRQADLSEMMVAVGQEFAPLIQPLSQRSAGENLLVSAHRCYAGDRSYVHFVFDGADGLTSISLTRRRGLEWIPFRENKHLDGYGVSAFQDGNDLVFVSARRPKPEVADMFEQALVFRMFALASTVRIRDGISLPDRLTSGHSTELCFTNSSGTPVTFSCLSPAGNTRCWARQMARRPKVE